jgi:hypothetical protein
MLRFACLLYRLLEGKWKYRIVRLLLATANLIPNHELIGDKTAGGGLFRLRRSRAGASLEPVVLSLNPRGWWYSVEDVHECDPQQKQCANTYFLVGCHGTGH